MADIATSFLAEPALTAAWDRPSALPYYPVSGLAGHLAGQINVVEKVLLAPEPTTAPIPALDYLLQARWLDAPQDGDVHATIRRPGADYAINGPQSLVTRTTAVLSRLHDNLP